MSLLAEGMYKGTIQEWAQKESPGKQTLYVEFNILLSSREGEPIDKPFKTLVPLWLSSKSIEQARRTLDILGFKDIDLDRLRPEHPERHDFTNTECEVKVEHEEYEGKKREKVNFAYAIPALSPKKAKAALARIADAWAASVKRANGDDDEDEGMAA